METEGPKAVEECQEPRVCLVDLEDRVRMVPREKPVRLERLGNREENIRRMT